MVQMKYNCPSCNIEIIYKNPRSIHKALKKKSLCKKCAAKKKWANAEYATKISVLSSDATTKMWGNSEYRNKVVDANKITRANDLFRDKQKAICSSTEQKAKIKYGILAMSAEAVADMHVKMSANSVKLWNTPEYVEKQRVLRLSDEYRARVSAASRKMWNSDGFKEKYYANMPAIYVSSIQLSLYEHLDNLGVKYFREYVDKPSDSECTVGPYTFDCVIPRQGKTTLLIECQGDYWHSIEKLITRDNSKLSYVNNYLADKYELKYIWEHEFKCAGKVIDSLKYWLGIDKLEQVAFDFSQISIRECDVLEYKPFLEKYHYLSCAPRCRTVYGAFLDDMLIAVCAFSKLVRQNIHQSLNCEYNSVREISRFCIHPRYHKYNFASWFISRCVPLVKNKLMISKIIAYSDTTYNHDGGIYKASGFIKDKIVKPDYWYADDNGWVMHKKALYNHARSLKMTESEFAELKKYHKINGKEKIRYVKELQ